MMVMIMMRATGAFRIIRQMPKGGFEDDGDDDGDGDDDNDDDDNDDDDDNERHQGLPHHTSDAQRWL